MWKRLGAIVLVGMVAGLTLVAALRVLGPAAPVPPGAAVQAQAPAPIGAGELTSEERVVIGVYKKVSPAVVHIASIALAYDFFFNVVPTEGAGSGFLIDEQGHILTNYHVVEGAQNIEVVLGDAKSQKRFTAKLVGGDPRVADYGDAHEERGGRGATVVRLR